jgi:hypothetical protein
VYPGIYLVHSKFTAAEFKNYIVEAKAELVKNLQIECTAVFIVCRNSEKITSGVGGSDLIQHTEFCLK